MTPQDVYNVEVTRFFELLVQLLAIGLVLFKIGRHTGTNTQILTTLSKNTETLTISHGLHVEKDDKAFADIHDDLTDIKVDMATIKGGMRRA